MKPPDEVRKDLVRQWLAKAEQDFTLLCFLLLRETGFFSAIGYHAQQAAEKYLKALLAQEAIEFPKTHNIGFLIELVRRKHSGFSTSPPFSCDILTAYGVESRYPGDLPDLSREDAWKSHDLLKFIRREVFAFLHDEFKNRKPCDISGKEIQPGDKILVCGKMANVEKVISPLSEEAHAKNCFDTGGIIYRREDGVLEQWSPDCGYFPEIIQ